MSFLQHFLNLKFFDNTAQQWMLALALVLIVLLIAYLAKRVGLRILRRLAKHTQMRIDDAMVEMLSATRLSLVVLAALWPAADLLTLPKSGYSLTYGIATVAIFLQLGLWGARLVHFWITHTREHARAHDPAALTSLGAVSFIVRLVLWAIVALLALDNLGVNVTALVAGLGVGGIAIGLALQNVLGDLFASLSIVLDKPFQVGDFVAVDEFLGTVENIGVKTTRLRSIDGEGLVFANSDLVKSRLRNYKQMQQRRVVFAIGVKHRTTADQLEQIPRMIREAIETQADTRFDRSHFTTVGASSMDFETAYWMLTPEYARRMDTQQAINLALVRRFADAGIQFAFPSRTLYFGQALSVAGEAD